MEAERDDPEQLGLSTVLGNDRRPECILLTPAAPPSRRVHITGATLALLAGAYAVEAAAMEHRDPYLRDLGEPTYLVIDPRVTAELGPLPRAPLANSLRLLLSQRLSFWVSSARVGRRGEGTGSGSP